MTDLSPAERYARSRARAASPFQRFCAAQDLDPDPFQTRAAEALDRGASALVAAPTGAGKTIVAEYAVSRARAAGRRAFYTTPIKALSNQKRRELAEVYGEDQVGLLTGDVSLHADAPVVVMTAEVLRNMIYEGSSRLDDLEVVVLDEVHYLADRFRGPVWEEIVIMLPDHVRLVSLSATVSNAEEFGAWLAEVRGDTEVIVSEDRPVPLYHHMMLGTRLVDLFDARAELNPELKRLQPAGPQSRRRRRGPRDHQPSERGPRRAPRFAIAAELDALGLLPAITFIFSRVGCSEAVAQCLASGLVLTDAGDRQAIEERLEALEETLDPVDLGVLGYGTFRQALLAGFAAHHAGMLPQFKECVEQLFQAGHVAMVFATETLALGINMPARTVVLEKLTKFNGEGHVSITPGEFTQLTGRAGRRGIDVEGHAVIVYSPQIDPAEAKGLASRRTYRLDSSFRPTYNMAANLATRLDADEAEQVLETSFAQYQADRGVVGLARRVRRHEDALASYREQMTCSYGDVAEFQALRDDLSRAQKRARRSRSRLTSRQIVDALLALRPGDVIALDRGPRRGHVVVVDPAIMRRDSIRPPGIVDAEGRSAQLRESEFAAAPEPLGWIRIPKRFDLRRPQARHDLASSLRAAQKEGRIAPPPKRGSSPAEPDPGDEIAELKARLAAHPVQGCPDRERHGRWAQRWAELRRETDQLIGQIEGRTSTVAQVFRRVRAVLAQVGVLPDHPAELTRIYGERDLLTALSVREGLWADLDPADIAALASSLVYHPRREESRMPDRFPGERVQPVMAAFMRLWSSLQVLEQQERLPLTPAPEPGLLWPMHRWARGASLERVLRGSDLAAGDFVRWAKQTVDLLDQISQAAPAEQREALVLAIESVRRGVVRSSL